MSQIASLSPTLRLTPLRSSRRATSVRVTAAASRPGTQKAQGPDRDPILEAVLREPVSFLGGIAAGFLALDVTQGALRGVVHGRYQSLTPRPNLTLPTAPRRRPRLRVDRRALGGGGAGLPGRQRAARTAEARPRPLNAPRLPTNVPAGARPRPAPFCYLFLHKRCQFLLFKSFKSHVNPSHHRRAPRTAAVARRRASTASSERGSQ